MQGTPEDAPEVWGHLTHSDHLVALRRVAFDHCPLGDAGVEALLDGPQLDRLASLELTGCAITDDGAQMLAADPRVARLVRFRLDNNLLSPIGVEALEAADIPVSRNQWFMPGNGSDDIPF